MKVRFQILALTIVTVLLAGAIVYAERVRPREIVVPVKGMVCEGCEEHLCEKLRSAPGVSAVTASHEDEQVTVVVSGWSHADAEDIRAIVKRAGYEPGE